MIRLDTHVVAWLHAGMVDRLSPHAIDAIESSELAVSPMVELELTYLHEVGRLSVPGAEIIADLRDRIGLRASELPMATVVNAAIAMSWTRDPFDRLITADAFASGASLLTKDEQIQRNYDNARW